MKIQMEGFHKIHDDLEKVIEKDDSTSSITTDSDDVKPEMLTCRQKLRHILETNKFQIGVVFLVIIDCLVVIGELLLDMNVVMVTDHKNHLAPKILHYISLGILSVFLVEISVRVFVYRVEFLKHKLEIFDAVIVVTSFVLDIVFRNNEGPESGAGLLVVLRLWRVTRILNGIVMSVKKQAEKRLQKERHLRLACEQELNKYREYCSAQEHEIELLRGILRKHGINDPSKQETPSIQVSTIDVIAEVNHLVKDSKGAVPETQDAIPLDKV